MRLKHMVKDKINYRATGKRNFLTRQTNQGRANDGGLKIGEMERDGIMAHGLSYFLNESYMVRGDQYYMAVCNKTGTIAIYNPDKNLFLSPFADGPLVFNRNVEGQEILDAVSKFGRSFSVLRVPFALKLLIQELQVMNIQMRIITEDNIDQLTNLSFQSKNINRLLHIDEGDTKRGVKEIIEEYTKNMEAKIIELRKKIERTGITNEGDEARQATEFAPSPSPGLPTNIFQDRVKDDLFNGLPDADKIEILKIVDPGEKWKSTIAAHEKGVIAKLGFLPPEPAFSPPGTQESPDYAPKSPDYAPKSPDYPPPGAPGSPDYAPGSPDFPPPGAPESPNLLTGGSINIFSDRNMNAAFNNLKGESQSQILQMEQGQRNIIMQQIMIKSAKNSARLQGPIEQIQNASSPLIRYFTNLPIRNQLGALQDGYKEVSSEFKQLAGKANDQKVTINTPKSIQQQLAGRLPLLAVNDDAITKTGDKLTDTFLEPELDDKSIKTIKF